MKKLFAAVAIAAFALTSAAPMVQAAPMSAGLYNAENANLHEVAAKKKAKKSSSKKKVTKASSSPAAKKA
jgi:hypothetical protein